MRRSITDTARRGNLRPGAASRSGRGSGAAAALLGLGLLLPAGASGAERVWTPPEQISQIASAQNFGEFWDFVAPFSTALPKVTIGADGRLVAGWIQFASSMREPGPRVNESYAAAAAIGTVDEGWSDPSTLAPIPHPLYPDVLETVNPLFDPEGRPSLVWKQGERFEWRTLLSARHDGDTWSAPERIEAPAMASTWTMKVWKASDGGLHALWQGDGTVGAARRTEAAGWSASDLLPGEWRVERLLFDHSGAAIAFVRPPASKDSSYGTPDTLFAAGWTPAGGWSVPHELGVAHGTPALLMGDTGEVIAVWELHDRSGTPGIWASVRSAVRAPAGDWSASVEIDPARPSIGFFTTSLALATAPDGDALLQRTSLDGTFAFSRAAGGSWSEPASGLPVMLNAPGQLLVNSRGDAVAVWVTGQYQVGPSARTDWRWTGCLVMAATRTAEGGWSRPHRLAEPMSCSDPNNVSQVDLELNEAGQALVLYPDRDEATFALRAAAFSFTTGTWDAPVRVSTPGFHALAGDLELNERGEAVVVWEQADHGRPGTAALHSAVYGARWITPPQAPALEEPRESAAAAAPERIAEAAAPEATVPSPALPVILSAFAAVRPTAREPYERRDGGRSYLVRLNVRGAVAPNSRLQLTHTRAEPGPLRPYADGVVVRSAARPQWARLVDEAGQPSAWRRITRDRARPGVRQARLVRGRAGVRLQVTAHDDASGVARMQLAQTRSRPGRMMRFQPTQALGARAPRWVRVKDGMGRASPWAPVRALP